MNRRAFLSLLPSIPLVPNLLGELIPEIRIQEHLKLTNLHPWTIVVDPALEVDEWKMVASVVPGKLWLDKNWNEITRGMKFYRPDYES